MPISSDLVRHIQSNSSTFLIGAMVPTLAFNYFDCVKRVRMRSYSGPFGLNTEKYGEIRFISPYSVQMRENTDQNNSEYGHVSRSIYQANFLIFQPFICPLSRFHSEYCQSRDEASDRKCFDFSKNNVISINVFSLYIFSC